MRKPKVACFRYERHCDVYVSNVWFSTGVLRSILDAFQNQRIDGFQLTGGGGVGIDVHVTESYTRPVPSLKKQTNRITLYKISVSGRCTIPSSGTRN